MKKGFTFAELMISLVIISVISAILYPTIANLTPNENAALFKSAYRSMSIALAEVMNDTSDGVVPTDLCTKLSNKLNVRDNNCAAAGGTFTTTNGMRWYVSDTHACTTDPASCYPIIIIDVASSNNDSGDDNDLPAGVQNLNNNYDINAATTAFTGQFAKGAQGGTIDDTKAQDTFIFGFNNSGRMVGMDKAGYANLEGKTYSCAKGESYEYNKNTKKWECIKAI